MPLKNNSFPILKKLMFAIRCDLYVRDCESKTAILNESHSPNQHEEGAIRSALEAWRRKRNVSGERAKKNDAARDRGTYLRKGGNLCN